MHKITVVAIAASLLGAPLCDAHAGSSAGGVFGFLSSNGTFRPLRLGAPAPKAAATTFRGSFVANFTFTIAAASKVPPTAPILCGLQAALIGTDTTGVSDFVAETDQATATRSGSQVTCKVVIPYAWTLSVPTFDNVTLSGTALAVDTTGNGRTSSFQLETIALPATVTYAGEL